MNQLSWLLYLGNVAGNMGEFLIFAGILAVIAAVGLFTYHWASFDALNTSIKAVMWRDEDKAVQIETLLKQYKRMSLSPLFVLLFGFICWFGAVLCPSSDTVYAIAASQVGENAMKTPIGLKAGQAIESWLDKQIASNKTADK